MELSVSNFGKISETTIKLNGITVIAGINNSGKSTLGKVLFSSFNALNDIDQKIKKERNEATYQLCNSIFREYSLELNKKDNRLHYNAFIRQISQKIARYLVSNNNFSEEDLRKYFEDSFYNNHSLKVSIDKDSLNELINKIFDEYQQILTISDRRLLEESITSFFSQTFSGQLTPVIKNNKKETVISLLIKGKNINIHLKNDICTNLNYEIELTKKAIYIDNPFIIDNCYPIGRSFIDNYLLDQINKQSIDFSTTGLFDSILSKEKLDGIENILSEVVKGDVIEDDSSYMFKQDNYIRPLEMNNLSTGLKSFILIKLLIQKNILKSKDVLILDEPEIHLHPEWQLKYAQLLVLLQKAFDLTILITTHSSHFLEAIDLYSKIYTINDICNYYLANPKNENTSTFEDVTGNLNVLYKNLVTPSLAIDILKSEHGLLDE